MTLQEWIDKVGAKKAAGLLGVAQRTIYTYQNHSRKPTLAVARRAVEASHGVVSFEEVYIEYEQ